MSVPETGGMEKEREKERVIWTCHESLRNVRADERDGPELVEHFNEDTISLSVAAYPAGVS